MKIVYIDAQNLHLGIKKLGWILDYQKLFYYLQKKYQPDLIKIFIGYIEKYQSFYDELLLWGYTIVFKQTSIKKDGSIKGNVDIDIAIACLDDYFINKLSTFILVSSDCNFISLLESCNKKTISWYLLVPNEQEVSQILRNYCGPEMINLGGLSFFLAKEKVDTEPTSPGDHDVPPRKSGLVMVVSDERFYNKEKR